MRAAIHLGSPEAMAPQQHQPHSTWRSPVPYLFGGLAAMMGLIAFALLLLACSYWRLSGYLEEGGGGGDGADAESGAGKPDDEGAVKPAPWTPEQRVVVIMAGDEKPTFLATPASSRASSFGDSARAGGSGGAEPGREGRQAPEATDDRTLQREEQQSLPARQSHGQLQDL